MKTPPQIQMLPAMLAILAQTPRFQIILVVKMMAGDIPF